MKQLGDDVTQHFQAWCQHFLLASKVQIQRKEKLLATVPDARSISDNPIAIRMRNPSPSVLSSLQSKDRYCDNNPQRLLAMRD